MKTKTIASIMLALLSVGSFAGSASAASYPTSYNGSDYSYYDAATTKFYVCDREADGKKVSVDVAAGNQVKTKLVVDDDGSDGDCWWNYAENAGFRPTAFRTCERSLGGIGNGNRGCSDWRSVDI